MPLMLIPSPCDQAGEGGSHEGGEEEKQIPGNNVSISQEQGTLLPALELLPSVS